MIRSKAIDESRLKKGVLKPDDPEDFSDGNIASQHIGSMFDFLGDNHKIKLKTRLDWLWRDIKGRYSDTRYKIRNRRVWRKTLNGIRPWEGFSGLLAVMQTHLRDYMETEEKYGHSALEERERCIASVKETLEVLERMKDPDEYDHRLLEAVDARYPEYKSLITRYKRGGFLLQRRICRAGRRLGR
jgi:hypothetical protein